MALISLHDVSVALGGPLVLDRVNLHLDRGERVCLMGRNGAGKSTLMKILSRDLEADQGRVECKPGVRLARLDQEVPEGLQGTVFEVAAGGLGPAGETLAEYHRVARRLEHEEDEALVRRLDRLQRELDADGGWHLHGQVERVVSRLKLNPDAETSTLSAGLKRRALLARALARKPDVLLLDEPTNHLDIEAITDLEDYLSSYEGALLLVTHDRMFLRTLATRILDLDRGRLTSWACDYNTFLQRKQEALEAEAHNREQFDKKLAREEAWIRRGVKERRTRNEGRVRALMKMREARRSRRDRPGALRMQVREAEKSGRLVIEARSAGFGYGDKPVIRDLTTTVMRGDRVGIVGPNGSGKTTLLRLLLGEVTPDTGTLRHGTHLEVAYFDQLHDGLDETRTVADNVTDGSDRVTFGGKTLHVLGYLKGFLFTPDRARSPITHLSGGERNRLLLARLFCRPSNVLVLDEPTNDLDLETLEVLEARLADYPGTLLLVSHDRALLNNVVTSCMVLEGEGRVKEYVGGYDDWVRQRGTQPRMPRQKSRSEKARPRERTDRPRKLTYKEKLELEALPDRIDHLEEEQAALHDEMSDPAFYRQDGELIARTQARLKALDQELAAAYRLWEELEERNE